MKPAKIEQRCYADRSHAVRLTGDRRSNRRNRVTTRTRVGIRIDCRLPLGWAEHGTLLVVLVAFCVACSGQTEKQAEPCAELRLRHYVALPPGTPISEANEQRAELERRVRTAGIRVLATNLFADRRRRTFVVMLAVAPQNGQRTVAAIRRADMRVSRRSLGNVASVERVGLPCAPMPSG